MIMFKFHIYLKYNLKHVKCLITDRVLWNIDVMVILVQSLNINYTKS